MIKKITVLVCLLLLLMCVPVFPQVGGRSSQGVYRATNGCPSCGFTSSNPPGLKQWLKSDAITGLANGDPVAAWSDSSGQGNHLAQPTGANRPTYQTGILNGIPGVLFDGINDYLVSGSIAALTSKTLFIVVKSGDENSNYLYAMGNNNWAIIQGYNGSVWEWYNSPRTTLSTISTTVFKIIQTSAGDTLEGEWFLGSDTNGNDNFNGYVVELLVYSPALESGPHATVLTYLNGRYAL